MKLLAYTHVVLWSATEPQRLSASARAAIEDGANELSVSIVTAWEIAIKQALGKLDLPEPAEQWLPEVLRRTGFAVAEIGLAAALRVRALPWHHCDPFDRLLIAHAPEDGYTIVTHDATLAIDVELFVDCRHLSGGVDINLPFPPPPHCPPLPARAACGTDRRRRVRAPAAR